MPRMSGIELLKHMRGSGDLRLFGFITTESSAVVRGEAHEEGASFIISKPFDAETFKAVFGGVDAAHASIVHEGLPNPGDVTAMLSHLIGRIG